MSIRRIKACLLTAACIGLVGLAATPASALGHRNRAAADCCEPCGTGVVAGAPGAAGAPAGPTQTVKCIEYVPT